MSVHRLLKWFGKDSSMDRWPGSGRPVTVTIEENEEFVGNLICSQQENPGTHLSPREIEKVTGISWPSVRRMLKQRGLKQFKRVKTPRMSSATQQRWTEWAGALAETFSKKRSIKRCVWQDEKDFTDVPFNAQNNRVYGMDKKDKIPGNQLFNHANKQSKKVVISAWVPWKDATKPFFVNESSLKVNEKTYKKHSEKQLFPEVDMNVTSWIFPQER